MALTQNRQQTTLVIILLVGAFLVVLNQMLVTPAFNAIMNEFAVSATTVQWLTSGYAMVEAIIIPLSAYLIGRFTTRRLYMTGLVVFIVGCLLCAWSPSFPVLMTGRVLQAACTGVVMPMTFTLILLVFPVEKRGMAMGFVSLVIGVAPVMGPVVAGVLIDSVGWHYMFVLMAGLMCILLIIAALFLRNYGEFNRITFDAPSVAFSTIGLFGVLYGLSTFTSTDQYWLVALMMAVGIAFLVLFVRRQLKLEVPMLEFKICRSRDYVWGININILCNAAIVAFGVIAPLYIQAVRGYPATMSGLILLPGALVGSIMAPIAGRIFDKRGARRICIIGATLLVLGFGGLSFSGTDSPHILIFLGLATITGFGQQCIINPVNTWGINTLDNSLIQHANAYSSTLGQVGSSFATALVVSLSALATHIAPDATPIQQACLGDDIAFGAITVMYILVLIFIVWRVHDRENPREVQVK